MSSIICCARPARSRLVLTGGVALNAVGNMRLLEHFNEAWFARAQQRKTRLHLWVPPVPGDPGVTIGAAWLFAHLAGAPRGAPMTHAFYCGTAADAATTSRARLKPTTSPRNASATSRRRRPRRHRRSDGVHGRAKRHHRAVSGRGRNRPPRARPSLDPRQPLRSPTRASGSTSGSNTARRSARWRRWRRWKRRRNISSCCPALRTPITTPTITWC